MDSLGYGSNETGEMGLMAGRACETVLRESWQTWPPGALLGCTRMHKMRQQQYDAIDGQNC